MEMGSIREAALVSHSFPLSSQPASGAQGRAGSYLHAEDSTTQMRRRFKSPGLCIMGTLYTMEIRYGWSLPPTSLIARTPQPCGEDRKLRAHRLDTDTVSPAAMGLPKEGLIHHCVVTGKPPIMALKVTSRSRGPGV